MQKYDEQVNSSHLRKSIFDRRNRSIIEKELQLPESLRILILNSSVCYSTFFRSIFRVRGYRESDQCGCGFVTSR